jgi:hypothetical protein
VSIDTTSGPVSGSTVGFGSTVDGAHALVVNAGQSPLNFLGTIGNSTPPTSLNVSSSGKLIIGASATTNINGDFTLNSTDLDFLAPVRVTGNLSIYTRTGAETIDLGTASTGASMVIDTTDLDKILAAATLAIGKSGTQSGTFTVRGAQLHAAVTGLASVTLSSDLGAGTIVFDNSISFVLDLNGNNVPLVVHSGSGGITSQGIVNASIMGTTSTVTLSTSASTLPANFGSDIAHAITLAAGLGNIIVDNTLQASGTRGAIFFHGLGSLSLGTIATGNRDLTIDTLAGSFDATFNGQVDLGAGTGLGSGNLVLVPAGQIIMAFGGSAGTPSILSDGSNWTFSSPMVVSNTAYLSEGAGAANKSISFGVSATINDGTAGTHFFTIDAGSANRATVSFAADIGAIAGGNLGSFTVSNADSVTIKNVGTASQDGVSGSFSVTTLTNGITWTGSNYRTGSSQTWSSPAAKSLATSNANTLWLTPGKLNLWGSFNATAASSKTMTLQSNDLGLNPAGTLAVAAFGIWNLGATNELDFQTQAPATTAMNVGIPAISADTANEWHLDQMELGSLNQAGFTAAKIVLGKAGAQAATTSITTTDLSATNGASTGVAMDIFADGAGGAIVFDDGTPAGTAAYALNLGTGILRARAAVSITSAHAANTIAEINTTASVDFDAVGGTIGTSVAQPLQVQYHLTTVVNIQKVPSPGATAPGGVWVQGVGGPLTLGSINTTGAVIADVYLGGKIYLTQNVTTGGQPLTYSQPAYLRPASGTLITLDTSPSGNVTFSSTLDEDDALAANAGTNSLTISAGTGTIAFNQQVGGDPTIARSGESAFKNLTLTGGNITFSKGLKTANGGQVAITHSGLLTISDATSPADNAVWDFDIAGSLIESGTGAVSLEGDIITPNKAIAFNTPVTLTGAVSINSGGGSIVFGTTLKGSSSGTENLTLTAGTGNVSFSGVVGATRLGAISIVSAGNVTATTLSAGSLAQTAGSGTTTFNGDLDFSAASGLSVNAANIVVNNTIHTSGNAVVTLNPGTLLTIASAGDMTLDGAFSQGGSGTVATAGDITTTNDAIGFGSAVTLAGPVAMATAGGNLSFGSSLDGAQNLTLTAGTGNVSFSGVVGATRLGVISIVSAGSVTATTLSAGSLAQTAGSGTTTFNGALDFSTASGLSVNATNIVVNSTVHTSGNGVATLNPGTLLTIAAAGDMTLDGAFSQGGSGTASTAGDITTTNDAIGFGSAVTLAGPIALTTAGGNLSFGSSLDGGQNLTLTAGTGNVSFSGIVGATRLGDISIVSAGNVTATTLSAGSLSQTAGSGTTTFNGALDFSTASGLSVNATNIVVNSTVHTSGNAVVTLNPGTLLTIASAGDMTLDGAFSQGGSGTASTAGDITTTNDAIGFGSAVTLTGAVALSSGSGPITFSASLNGAQSLIANSSGTTTFAAAVGLTNPPATITTDAAGTTAINGGLVKTSGAQVFNDAVTMSADLSLDAGSSTTTFDGTVTAVGKIAAITSVNFNADVTLGGSSSSQFSQSVTFGKSSGTQNFSSTHPVTFGTSAADLVTLSGDAATAVTISTTANNAGLIFNSTITGPRSLSIQTHGSGRIAWNAPVSIGSTSLASANVLVNTAGLDIKASTPISTSTNKDITIYVDDLILQGAGVTMDAGSGIVTIAPRNNSNSVEFAPTNDPSIVTSTYINSSFSWIRASSLHVGSSSQTGDIHIGNTISGTNGRVVAGGTLAFIQAQSLGGSVYFENDYDSTASTQGKSLAIYAGSGGIVFGKGSLAVTTSLGTGSFTANPDRVTGAGKVVIGQNTMVSANGGISFFGADSTIESPAAKSLTLNSSGVTTLESTIGAASPLASLATDAGGTLVLKGSGIKTSGSQSYGEDVSVVPPGQAFSFIATSTGTGAVTWQGRVDGATDITINTGGSATFNAAVGSQAPLGTASGTSLTLASSGDTTFASSATLKTNSGILQSGSGLLTFNENVNVLGSSTASTFSNSVVLDSETFTSAGSVNFGSGNGDSLSLANGVTMSVAGNLDVKAVTSLSGGSGKDVSLTVAGALTFASMASVTGNQDLTFTVSGTTTINAPIGGTSAATAIGDGSGPSLTIASNGATVFASTATLRTSQGITQTGSGLLTFNENVDILGAGTATLFDNSVVLDSEVFTSPGSVTFGSGNGDTLSLANGVAIAVNGNVDVKAGTSLSGGVGKDVTMTVGGTLAFASMAPVTGNQDLSLTITGTTTFNAAVGGSGAATAIGDGTGPSLLISSSGPTIFDTSATLRTSQGITQTGNGLLTFMENVDILGAATATVFENSVVLDSETFTSVGSITFGSGNGDTLSLAYGVKLAVTENLDVKATTNLSGGEGKDVAMTVGGALTFASMSPVSGNQDVLLTVSGTTTFNAPLGGTIPATAIGDGNGYSFIIASTGETVFGTTATLRTAQGIAQTGRGRVSFNESVDILGNAPASNFTHSVLLDSEVFTSAGSVTFGTAATDGLALANGVTMLLSGSGALDIKSTTTLSGGAAKDVSLTTADSISIEAPLDGAQDLFLSSAGPTLVTAPIGATTALGDGVGVALTIASAGSTTFGSTATLKTASGIVATGTGNLVFENNVTVGAGDAATRVDSSIRFAPELSTGITWTSAVDTTLGSIGKTLVLDVPSQTTAPGVLIIVQQGTSNLTINAAVSLGADLTLNIGGNSTAASTIDGAIKLTANTTGLVTFNGAIGKNVALADLVVTGIGGIAINGGSVATTATQTWSSPVAIGADLAVSGNGLSFLKTIDNSGTTAHSLTITGTASTKGSILVDGAIGSVQSLSNISISAPVDLILTGIGAIGKDGTTGTVTVSTTEAGTILLKGGSYRSGGLQSWSAVPLGLRARFDIDSEWGSSGSTVSLPSTDLYLDAPGTTLTLKSAFVLRRLVGYRGTLALAGQTISTMIASKPDGLPGEGDMVLFGAAYSAIDKDWKDPANTRFAYHTATLSTPNPGLRYLPGGGTYDAATGIFSTAPTLSLADLAQSSIVVAGNFYSNGVDLQGSAAWNLTVPDNSAAAPVFNTGSVSTANMWASAIGTYAIVFNASVKGAQGQGGFINAAAVSPTTNAVEKSNNCVDVTGTNNANIVFGRPEIKVATTRYDDVLEITFMDQFGLAMKIENSHGEIQTALSSVKAADGVELGGIWYNSHATGVRFIEAFEDVACTIPTTDAKTLLGNDLSTFFLRIDRSDSAFRWNTDATGLSAGRQSSTAVNDLGSTDRGRAATSEQPSHRDTIVDISLIKGLLNAADGKTLVRAYGSASYGATPFAAYTATLDGTRPVLIAVRTGQETHLAPTAGQLPVDSHNYFELEYSEAVGLGDLAAGSSYGNIRSGLTFASTAEHGGDYTSDGTTAVLQGYLSLAGTVSRGAKPNVSGVAPTQTANALSRADGTPERVRIHLAGWAEDGSSLNSAWTWYWPGWLEDLSQPAGSVVSLENNGILDGSGNPIEPSAGATSASSILAWSNGFASAKAAVTISSAEQAGQTYGVWDIWEPTVALSRNKSNWTVLYGEIVPLDFDNNTRIDRLEFHLMDNARFPLTAPPALDDMTKRWASIRGWIADDLAGDEKAASWFGLPDTRGGARPARQNSSGAVTVTSQTSGGIRDSSMTVLALGSFLAWDAAVDLVGKTATASHNASFKSYVTSAFFQPAGSVDVPDDPYFAIVLRDTDPGYNWTSGSTLHLSYEVGGGITDLAGNRLKAIADIMTVQRVAPRFRLSLAIAGSSKKQMYLQFTKAVNIESQAGIEGLLGQSAEKLKTIFRFDIPDLYVVEATPILDLDGKTQNKEVMLTLNRQLSASDILGLTFGVQPKEDLDPVTGEKISGSFIIDEAAATPLSPDESHRLSDLGLGVIEVNAATDGVHDVKDPLHPEIQAGTVDTPTSALGALRIFDGSGRLLDRDITVYSSLDPMLKGKTSYENLPVQLGYDVNPSTAYAPFIPITGRDPDIGTTWLPGILPGFNDKANAEARTITPFWNGGTTSLLRSFRIPGNDSEVKPGANLGFMFSLGGLYCLRATSPDDPRQFDLFRLGIDEVKQQRGSVTIQSNVIDPTKGERTAVQVVLPQAGTLTITIFTLDGDLVKKVFNDRQAAGSYTFFWDGRNLAGDAVARGVYFVRVVAQGIDEIRKVMVVR